MADQSSPSDQQGSSWRQIALFVALVIGLPLMIGLLLGDAAIALGLFSVEAIALAVALVAPRTSSPAGRERITWAETTRKPTYFDELVRINIENLDRYYRLVEAQTSRSFTTSIVTGLIGFALVAGGLAIGLSDAESQHLSYVSAGAGLFTEFISAVFFYLYRRTVRQLKDYHDSLLSVQRVLLAFKAIDDLSDEDQKVEMLRLVIDHLMTTQEAMTKGDTAQAA